VVVSLASLDVAGVVREQRSYALATPNARAYAGTFHGAVGLWVREGASRLRFHPLEGASSEMVEESTAGCAGAQPPEGEVFRVGDITTVRGEDWLVDPGVWIVEERLAVAGGSACVASIAGRVAREGYDGQRASRGRAGASLRAAVDRARRGHDARVGGGPDAAAAVRAAVAAVGGAPSRP
jgi:hypothetical protein